MDQAIEDVEAWFRTVPYEQQWLTAHFGCTAEGGPQAASCARRGRRRGLLRAAPLLRGGPPAALELFGYFAKLCRQLKQCFSRVDCHGLPCEPQTVFGILPTFFRRGHDDNPTCEPHQAPYRSGPTAPNCLIVSDSVLDNAQHWQRRDRRSAHHRRTPVGPSIEAHDAPYRRGLRAAGGARRAAGKKG